MITISMILFIGAQVTSFTADFPNTVKCKEAQELVLNTLKRLPIQKIRIASAKCTLEVK